MTKYNIVFDKGLDVDQIKTALEQQGASILSVFSSLGIINLSANSLDFSTVPGVLGYEEDLNITPVESFEWHQLRVTSTTLPLRAFYLPKNLGDGVNVYVVDSGIDQTHPEFSHTTVHSLYSYNGDFTPANGHGTAVASMIAGKNLGISPNAILHDVKVPTGLSTTISVLLGALDSIVGFHDANKVGVVNCSWTIPKSQLLDSKIMELQNLNLVVVAAAGNTMQMADNFSPVGLDTVLGVGASDAYDRVISWGSNTGSNWGPEVDLFAPGIDVTCADMSTGGTVTTSGTSLAAGVVSGVVAQYIVLNPSNNASEIQNFVLNSTGPDLLFRNESVYGTTPNSIIQAPMVSNIFLNVPVQGIACPLGVTTEFQLSYISEHVGSIETDFQKGKIHFTTPEWITFVNDTLTITPPENLTPGMYHVFLLVKNPEGVEVINYRLGINIYQNTPEENENYTEAYFFELNSNSEVVLTLANCSFYSYQCSSAFDNCGGKGASGCQCGGASNCYTMRTS